MKKRILSILLAISLLLCAAPQLMTPVSAAEIDFSMDDPLRYGWQVLSQMDNAENLLFVYEKLVEGIANTRESISVCDKDHGVNPEELGQVLTAVRSDYPEFFWLGLSCRESLTGNKVCDVLPEYTMDDGQIATAKASLEQAASLLLTGLNDKSDYEISRLIHDRLAAHMSYQYSDNDQTIYGALVEKEAVCAGYASAYQYLMQQAGIPAWKVTGSSINPATGSPEGHAWTLTCLDGAWYHTDLTWDDQGNLGNLYHAYLNVTTQQILQDHALDPFFAGYLPECSAEADNYFVKNHTQVGAFDADQIANALKKDHLNTHVYETGDISAFLKGFSDNFRSIIQKLGLSGTIQYGYSILGREIALHIWDGSYAPFPVGITLNALPNTTVWTGSADVTGGMLTVHYDDDNTQTVAMDASMISGFDPNASGDQVVTVTYNGCKEYFTVRAAGQQPPALTTPGDMTGDDQVNNDDVVLLLWHTLFPEEYPMGVSGDVNNDGETNNDDVVLLLWHTLFPEDYPL